MFKTNKAKNISEIPIPNKDIKDEFLERFYGWEKVGIHFLIQTELRYGKGTELKHRKLIHRKGSIIKNPFKMFVWNHIYAKYNQ